MDKNTLKTIERVALWVIILITTLTGHSNYQDYIMLASKVEQHLETVVDEA